MTLLAPRAHVPAAADRIASTETVTFESHVLTCSTCAHPAAVRTGLDRAERAVLRLVGSSRARRCGAESSDIHEATSWGEPPCACTSRWHR